MTESDAPEIVGHNGKGAAKGRPASAPRLRNAAVLAPVALLWLAFDQATKAFFNGYEPGDLIAGPFLGLFDFRLVHNTGAAWGMFDGATQALGVFSLAVCVLLALYVFVWAPDSSRGVAFGAGLVIAGGIGNAVDRFAQGYVVDFIETTFIDFPVFNIADIGVTCGVVILFAALVLEWRHADRDVA